MKTTALIGKGYWGSKIKKYISEFFNLKYVVGSEFDKNIIWEDKEITSVIIATPIETHYALTKEALQNNKHVFVEKPIAVTTAEARELIKLAEDNNLILAVEYTQTFAPSILKVVELLNKIGDIRYIEMSTKHLGRFMNFDVFWLLASHHLSILDLIVPLDKLNFKKEQQLFHNKLCTTGCIEFWGNDNIKGKIEVSTDFPEKEMRLVIYGSLGCIVWDGTREEAVTSYLHNRKYAALPKELIKNIDKYMYDEHNNLKYSIKYFHDVLNQSTESNAQRALRVTEILETT